MNVNKDRRIARSNISYLKISCPTPSDLRQRNDHRVVMNNFIYVMNLFEVN